MSEKEESTETEWAKAVLTAYRSRSDENGEWADAQESLVVFEQHVQRMNTALKQERSTLSFHERVLIRSTERNSNKLVSSFELVVGQQFPSAEGSKSLGHLNFHAVVGGYAKLTYGKEVVAEGPTNKLTPASIPAIMDHLQSLTVIHIKESWLDDRRRNIIAPLSLESIELE